MTKTKAWALKDKHGRYVKELGDPYQPFRTLVFRTQRHAIAWLQDNPYWKNKASAVHVVITVKEAGEP